MISLRMEDAVLKRKITLHAMAVFPATRNNKQYLETPLTR